VTHSPIARVIIGSTILCVLIFPFYQLYFRIRIKLSRMTCAWCARGFALFTREGSRCCRSCGKKGNRRISELRKPYSSTKRSIVPLRRKARNV
jgi:hypothetical protein